MEAAVLLYDKSKVFERIYDGCFFFFGTGTGLSAAGMAIVIVLMLMDAQLVTNLPDVSGVDFEAVLLLHILFNIIVAVNRASIGLQFCGIYGNAEMVADLFPT